MTYRTKCNKWKSYYIASEVFSYITRVYSGKGALQIRCIVDNLSARNSIFY